MKYLMDSSSLRSASKGLGSYGFHAYMRESSGTEGLTQLLDIARLVDLVVLSDEILVSERIAKTALPDDVSSIIRFVSLKRDPAYFTNLSMYNRDIDGLKGELNRVETLLKFKVVEDFISEIDNELTADDYYYVEGLADTLFTITLPELHSNNTEGRIFRSLLARTLQYLQTADLESVPYICHAYRAPIVRMFHPRFTDLSFDLYGEYESKLRKWLMETFDSERLEFNLPMLFVAVLRETKTPDELFKIAWQFRLSKEVVRIKQLMSEIRDNNNQINLLRYAEFHRIAEEETKNFHKQFSVQLLDKPKGSFSAEFSVSPTSIEPQVSVDLLKLSGQLVSSIKEWKHRSSISVIFKMARKTYEILSVENDLHRLWGIKLTESHKLFLQQISQYCDI